MVDELKALNGGTLPAYLSPPEDLEVIDRRGSRDSHPVVYFTADKVLCAACANGENGSMASPDSGDPGWKLVIYAIHSWGPPELCTHCNKVIESARGDPRAANGDGS